MTLPPSGAAAPADPAQDAADAAAHAAANARFIAKVRWLMLLSGFATALGIAVTVDVGGGIEVRTFDLKTLRPAGRLKFATEP